MKLDSELKLKGASLPVPLLHCLTAASVPLALAVTGSHGGSCRNSESPARWTRPGTQGTRDCQWCTTAAADSESWSRGSSESMSLPEGCQCLPSASTLQRCPQAASEERAPGESGRRSYDGYALPAQDAPAAKSCALRPHWHASDSEPTHCAGSEHRTLVNLRKSRLRPGRIVGCWPCAPARGGGRWHIA